MNDGKDKLRIAILSESVNARGGGIATVLHGIYDSFKPECYDIKVFSASELSRNVQDQTFKAADIVHEKTFPFFGYSYQPGCLGKVTRFGPTITHLHGLWTHRSMVALNMAQQSAVVISPHGMLDKWALANSFWKKKIVGALCEHRLIRNATCMHALCESEVSSIRDFGYLGPIALIPNGVDLPDSSNNSVMYNTSHSMLTNNRRVLLYLGRIHPKKGLNKLVHAFARAIRNDNEFNWVLRIAGWDQGDTETELQALVRDLSLGTRVEFLGPQFGDDKIRCFQDATAFVLPSLSEGLPMVVLEAWSYQLPVIMTRECNLLEAFAQDAAFELPQDPAAAATTLRQVLSLNDDYLHAVGKNGFELVSRQYTWSKVRSSMTELYEWLAGKGNQPEFVILH